jgi:hypothetical protein
LQIILKINYLWFVLFFGLYSLSHVCFKWLTVHRANMTHLRLGMWEEIVDADGNDGITKTTKRIPPPLVSWFPSVRTLHIGPKFIQGWDSAEYKLADRSSAFERVAMPKKVHQMVMNLLAVQPFERLEEVHFDCLWMMWHLRFSMCSALVSVSR